MLQAAAQRVQSSAKWRDMFIIATVSPSPHLTPPRRT
jgi:hypothetical protein